MIYLELVTCAIKLIIDVYMTLEGTVLLSVGYWRLDASKYLFFTQSQARHFLASFSVISDYI